MICRNLTRRLEALETRIAPANEPLIVQLMYVTPDGSEEDADRFELPMPLALGRSSRLRQRAARAQQHPEFREIVENG